MPTIALELVPPAAEGGEARLHDELGRLAELLRQAGLDRRLNALLIPGMIAEESDRPIPLEDKLDPLQVARAARRALELDCVVTQVTAFDSAGALEERLDRLERESGVRRVVFVGVPRTLADGQGPGLAPTDALARFRDRVPDRGVIVIPTRDDEKPRFEAKVRAGASFGLTQLLCSDHVTSFVPALALQSQKPELLLSFAYVPKVEERVGLIRWLIRDTTEPARREMEWVREIAPLGFAAKREALLDVYRRVVEGLAGCDLPLGLHFECPYGFSPYAFEVFGAMLDHWDPRGSLRAAGGPQEPPP